MVNSLFRSAERLGVSVRYEAEVVGLDVRDGHFHSASVVMRGKTVTIPAKAVVVAAGGFQSNLAWLRQAWGPAADNFLIRGAPFDTGTLLKILLDHGAESVGEPTQAHMVPIDARSPKFDGGIVTRLDCVTLGIVVNKNGERYYDEGEDFWPMRYAIWGRLVAQQPDQISYVFIDSKTLDRFMPSVFPPVKGNSIAEVAEQFNLPVDKVQRHRGRIQPCGSARKIRPHHPGRLQDGRLDAAQDALGAAHRPAAFLRLPAAARPDLHLLRRQDRQTRRR